jgi:hypothetical protein
MYQRQGLNLTKEVKKRERAIREERGKMQVKKGFSLFIS